MIGNFNVISASGMYFIGAIVSIILFPILFHKANIKWWHGLILTPIQIVFAALFAAGFASMEQHKFAFVGVSFYGTIFSLWIIPIIYAAITKLQYKKVLDTIVPLHMLMLCFMKIGCTIEGCCGGIQLHNGTIFPIQKVESAVAFVLFILLVVFQKKIQGIAYPVMLVSYGTVRFIEEFFRWHEKEYFGFMSIGQIWSILAFVIGLALLLAHYFVGRKKAKAIS